MFDVVRGALSMPMASEHEARDKVKSFIVALPFFVEEGAQEKRV